MCVCVCVCVYIGGCGWCIIEIILLLFFSINSRLCTVGEAACVYLMPVRSSYFE